LHEGGLAAVLWAGEGAVASHVTAARIFGAGLRSEKPHIWISSDRHPRSNLVIVHRGEIARNDRRMRDGVPITSPARTLVDLATMLDEESLESVVEDFFHRGVTTPLAVQRCLDATGGTGRVGSHLLRALLADRDEAPLERKLEVKLWRMLRKAGMRPVRQYEVRCGTNMYRLDFAWPILKVAVEGEGFAAHGGRLAHVRDNRRLADLVAVGWRVLPVTWEECTQAPDAVIERVRGALLRAA
jgi:very-short-patch-repair endonuclease